MNINIREKIEEILRELVPGINVLSEDLMAENGVESLTIIQLISELDLAFEIEITFDDIVNNSFHSVDSIEKMVLAYINHTIK